MKLREHHLNPDSFFTATKTFLKITTQGYVLEVIFNCPLEIIGGGCRLVNQAGALFISSAVYW